MKTMDPRNYHPDKRAYPFEDGEEIKKEQLDATV